jgi:hypothetical protein
MFRREMVQNQGPAPADSTHAVNLSDSESEKEEYMDSGLPPPCPYVRRKAEPDEDQIKPLIQGVQSLSARNLRSCLQLSEDLDTPSCLLASAGSAKITAGGASETDIFAERKKKLQSRVMTQSMPEIRDVRSLYNRGIGQSIGHRPMAVASEAKSSRPTLDIDSLLTDL